MSIQTLICFDFGIKRIGIASGQVITRTASPLGIITCHNEKPDWVAIEQVIKDWGPDALVVGVPISMDGSSQEMTQKANQFMRQLEGRYRLPVYSVDERLSTFEAKSRSGMENRIDAVAAQAILETWFAENRDKYINDRAPDTE